MTLNKTYIKNKIKFETRIISYSFFNNICSHLYYYPVPSNLNYFWGFGSVLGFLLVIQILTGILLAMHYSMDTFNTFNSIEFIMRNVFMGWFLRYIHSTGASLIFGIMYIHISRSLYYRTYRNITIWYSGMVLFLLLMATGFLGYVCVWGQMSLWGATVITNLFAIIPYIGSDILLFLWGGFSIDNPALKRFFILHFLLPFIVLILSVLHILQLHKLGSSNPLGIDVVDYVNFYPKYYLKDLFFIISFYGCSIIMLVIWNPNLLGHPDNYVMANNLITPKHITPEWYFEPFYAILRSIPNKIGGVLIMLMALCIYFYIPLLNFTLTSSKFSFLSQILFWNFVLTFCYLGYLGMCPIQEPYILYSKISTIFYFSYFLFGLPFMALLEASI